jgi:hypothetical protein
MMATCFDPTLMTDDVLVAYSFDPEAVDTAVQSHIQDCVACQEILSTIEQMNTAFIRFDCPTGKQLFEYTIGLLAPADAQAIVSHLQTCTLCQDEYTQVQSTSLPELVPTSPFKALSTLPRLIASLISVALAPPLQPMTQTRAAEVSGEDIIQEYATDALMLSLRQPFGIIPIVIYGGLSAGDGVIARLLHAGSATIAHEVVIHDDAFTFDTITPGVYDLEVICTDRIVTVATLSIPLSNPSEQ